MEKKRLWIYLGICFGLTWGLLGACVLAGLTYGGTGMSLCFFACMLLPAISSLLTRWITREGFGKMGFGFGWKQGGWKCYVAAALGPASVSYTHLDVYKRQVPCPSFGKPAA